MTKRTDAEVLQWLLKCLGIADRAICDECDLFGLQGNLREGKGAGDALDAMRTVFGFDLYRGTRDEIEAAMDADGVPSPNQRTDAERLEWLCRKSVIAIWTDKDGNLKPDSKLDYLFSNPNAPDTRFDLIRHQLDRAMDAEQESLDPKTD